MSALAVGLRNTSKNTRAKRALMPTSRGHWEFGYFDVDGDGLGGAWGLPGVGDAPPGAVGVVANGVVEEWVVG